MITTEITPQMDAQQILDIVEKELEWKYRERSWKELTTSLKDNTIKIEDKN